MQPDCRQARVHVGRIWRCSANVQSTRWAVGEAGSYCELLNPLAWNPVAVDRWGLRIAGFFRWIVVLIWAGAAVGFLAWVGVDATNEYRLSRHGVVVTATVENTAPDGKDTQYLLFYGIPGRHTMQWSTDLQGLRIGDSVTLIVDRTDITRFEPKAVYDRRWVGYAIRIVVSAIFGWFASLFIRMDAAGFRRYARARYGLARTG
jgi:hypothetical protein